MHSQNIYIYRELTTINISMKRNLKCVTSYRGVSTHQIYIIEQSIFRLKLPINNTPAHPVGARNYLQDAKLGSP